MFADDSQNLFRGNQFLSALKRVLQHGALADEVDKLLRQMPAVQLLNIGL